MKKEAIVRRLRSKPIVIDAHNHVGIDPVNYLRGDFPYALSGEDLALRMETQEIEAAVCFPMLYTSYFRLRDFSQGRFVKDAASSCAVPYQVENVNLCNEIYHAFPRLTGTLLPFAFFDPGRKQKEQAACLKDLAARYPLFGLKTACSYMHSHVTDLLKKGKPLLDLAAELNIPLMLHTSVVPGDPWANVFSILEVVKARPDVRFCLAHTCRFDRRALDAAATLDNCFVDLSAFHIHCTLARKNSDVVAAKPHRFPADYRRHALAMQKIATAYPDTILWGSDTPFNLFKSRAFDKDGNVRMQDLPCDPLTEITEFNKLPAALRRRIAYRNTLRWLTG